MLSNYDARAVADVMGIAFREDAEAGGTGSKAARAGSAAGNAHSTAFVLDVDPGSVRIVDVRTKDASSRSGGVEFGGRRAPVAANARMRLPSPVLIEKAVENGLPRLVLRHVAERIAGADRAKISPLEWHIVPKTTLERRERQLSPLESERTERVARIFVHASRALGSEAEARAFLTAPHPGLDGRAPIDAARTDLGTRRIEQILNALEYGLAL